MLRRASRNCIAGRGQARVSRLTRNSILVVALLTVAFVFPTRLAWTQSRPHAEYEVKAAFLFNFAKFIEWPPNSFASPQTPMALCVLGKDPFEQILDDTLRGRAIGNRPLEARRLRDISEARHCHMVFVSSSVSPRLAEIIESLRGANVLLVGDSNGFAASGGTIQFTMEGDLVRFTINIDAVNRAGLMFSSKLRALARIVHDQDDPKER